MQNKPFTVSIHTHCADFLKSRNVDFEITVFMGEIKLIRRIFAFPIERFP